MMKMNTAGKRWMMKRFQSRSFNVWLLASACILCRPSDIRAETLALVASLDATLIEDFNGELANGSGPAFFAGRTGQGVNSRRRALVYFDIASALPADATVTSAQLSVVLTPSNAPVARVALHRVLNAWSEGPSAAEGGSGAAAEDGDATWLHTYYDSVFWSTPGGDFHPNPSASTAVGVSGTYVWGSSQAMLEDVQGWLDDPTRNHGWLLIGDESAPSTSKRFASREDPADVMRPVLIVDYQVPCHAAGLMPAAQGLCRAYCEALDCAGTEPRGSARACARLAQNFARHSGGAPLPCEPSVVEPSS